VLPTGEDRYANAEVCKVAESFLYSSVAHDVTSGNNGGHSTSIDSLDAEGPQDPKKAVSEIGSGIVSRAAPSRPPRPAASRPGTSRSSP
jgi:hypothetical protein